MKKVGLALGSGGWRGLAHIGVIKELLDMGVEIGWIAGSSAGALIGGLWGGLRDVGKIEGYFEELKYKDLLRAFNDPFAESGVLKGKRSEAYLRGFLGKKRIEDLDIEYGAVATEALSGKSVVIRRGDLVKAIRASGSMPFVLEPVEIEGTKLIDGGVSNPVPVEIARELGAEKVISVSLYGNVFSALRKKGDGLGKLDVLKIGYYSMMSKLSKEDAKKADLMLEPKLEEGSFGILRKFVNNIGAVEKGVMAVREKREEIKSLLS